MIRYLEQKDKENWEKLYKDYADFYKVSMNKGILDTLWTWIQDNNHIVNGIWCELEGKIVGIAHYMRMPRQIKDQNIEMLEKLVVDTECRGKKIAKKNC